MILCKQIIILKSILSIFQYFHCIQNNKPSFKRNCLRFSRIYQDYQTYLPKLNRNNKTKKTLLGQV